MSKWKCVCCGLDDPCYLDVGSVKGKPPKCPIDADIPNWTPAENEQFGKSEQTPDWCKVGGWVYEKERKEYFKITKVDYLISIRNADGKGQYGHGAFVDNCVQARLRPYNAEEMRELVGKVVEDRDGNLYLAVCYIPGGRGLLIGGCYFNAQEIIDRGYTIDGKPCGKLEHLENGEWVE